LPEGIAVKPVTPSLKKQIFPTGSDLHAELSGSKVFKENRAVKSIKNNLTGKNSVRRF
jgi:hypothetical protein